jgi:hypothetical protein
MVQWVRHRHLRRCPSSHRRRGRRKKEKKKNKKKKREEDGERRRRRTNRNQSALLFFFRSEETAKGLSREEEEEEARNNLPRRRGEEKTVLFPAAAAAVLPAVPAVPAASAVAPRSRRLPSPWSHNQSRVSFLSSSGTTRCVVEEERDRAKTHQRSRTRVMTSGERSKDRPLGGTSGLTSPRWGARQTVRARCQPRNPSSDDVDAPNH